LVYHNAELQLGTRTLSLVFGQQEQNWLESMRFDDGSTFKEVSHGKGRIFWCSYPVELSEDLESTSDLYAYVASRLNLAAAFRTQTALPHGILVFPTALADSIVYVIISDSVDDARINLQDRATGSLLSLKLRSQHAAIAVIGRKEKRVVAKYGF